MIRVVAPFPYSIALFVGMLICLEIGRRMGRRKLARDPKEGLSGHGVVDGAVFALFGLLVAFTFAGAPLRLEQRTQLIAEEANAIGTAYLRLDLLPANSQRALREEFRRYVDSRLATYRKLPDVQAAAAELSRSVEIQKEIWVQAVGATRLPDSHPEAGKLLLPTLNSMIDITTTRTIAAKIHPPVIIFVLLYVLALVCSVLAGYDMAVYKQRSWLHILSYTVVIVIAVFIVLEIEYPRRGLIPMEAFDQVLIDVRNEMN